MMQLIHGESGRKYKMSTTNDGVLRSELIVIDRIENFFFRKKRPLYLGNIAVEIGYSLGQTQKFVDGMILSGVLKQLDHTERERMNLRHDGVVYVWVGSRTVG